MDRPPSTRLRLASASLLVILSLVLWLAPAASAAVSTGDGGWVWQRGLEAGTDYGAVAFSSPDSGWVVGSGGRIMHTFDGGETWYRQRSGTDKGLLAVDIPDGQNGWVVGADGTILRTTDGGDTWTAQTSPITGLLNSIAAVSAQEAWVCGSKLLHTTDGGATWETTTVLDDYSGSGNVVFDADGRHGWIGDGYLGQVRRTADGGQTWSTASTGCGYVAQAVASNGQGVVVAADMGGYFSRSTDWGATWQNVDQVYLDITAVAFASESTAWAISDTGGFLRSTDAGQTWTYIISVPWALASLAFADETNGWAVGVNGSMIRTDETGRHWHTERAEPQEQLWDVQFPDATTGWAIGFESTALRTTDGGEQWSRASLVRPERLDAVDIAGSRAWAVGTAGSIFASTDGGVHWHAQESGTADELKDVVFADADHGWAAGDSGTILRTVDGGGTWVPCESRTFSAVTDISVVDQNTAWFVAGGTAVTTSDGGDTFRGVQLPYTWFTLIDFVDADHGWVADGQGRICRTSDGGQTWDDFSFGAQRIFFQAIDFSSASEGWAYDTVGWTTSDGGQTWTRGAGGLTQDQTQSVQGFDFAGDRGWAVGYQGTILATTDRGVSWAAQTSSTTSTLSAVAAGEGAAVCAVGDLGLVDASGDDGTTWVTQSLGLPRNLSALSAFDASSAYVAGQYGFSRTTDAGGLWSFLPQGYGGVLMDFPDPLHGWMAGYSGELAQTTDGGLTWTPRSIGMESEFFSDVEFLDSQTGWLLGLYNRIYRTTDGGATWEPVTIYGLDANAIHFISESVGYAVGNFSISRTTDGGETWQQVVTTSAIPGCSGPSMLTAVDFADPQHGWAVGESGTLVATTDGGDTWVAQDPGTDQWLRGVAAISDQSVWLVGEQGAILHTTNGGFPRPDDTAPVTTLDASATGAAEAVPARSAATAQWFTTPPRLALRASDAGGLQVTAWGVDPPSTNPGVVDWRRGTAPELAGEGLRRVCFRSVDEAGNAEGVKVRLIGVDHTAPAVTAPKAATVRKGKKATLRYRVADVAGSTQTVTIVIKSGRGKLMKRVVLKGKAANAALTYSFACSWTRGKYRFSVSAVDPVGLRTAAAARNVLTVR